MNDRIALLADGRLIVAATDGTSKRHDCEFAAEIERREQRSAEKNSWLRGDQEAPGGMFNRSSLWGGKGVPRGVSVRPRVVAVAGGDRPESMVYALWTGVVGASAASFTANASTSPNSTAIPATDALPAASEMKKFPTSRCWSLTGAMPSR
jgi:hypothetical protein